MDRLDSAEAGRLEEADRRGVPWRRWGPYLSERQWGTVREDYSAGGDAWSFFPHDQARSRAYRWGEDGIAGISDDQQRLCLSLALWNGRDPILKERMFGLTNSEGNHGEDVKEYYFYLDSTPTHSYMNTSTSTRRPSSRTTTSSRRTRARGRDQFEYELLDTGVFDDDRYFDVDVEYAKAVAGGHPGPGHRPQPRAGGGDAAPAADAAGSATPGRGASTTTRPRLSAITEPERRHRRSPPTTPALGRRWLYCDRDVPLLFTENETNAERLFGTANASPWVKDGIGRCVVQRRDRRGEPGPGRHEGGGPLRAGRPGGR